MRSHLSKSWIYTAILVGSLFFTFLSLHSGTHRLQLQAFLPFNDQPLLIELADEYSEKQMSDLCG